MFCKNLTSFWPAVLLSLLTACTPNNVALGPDEFDVASPSANTAEVEIAREGVFVQKVDEPEPLPLAELVPLEVGQQLSVNDEGRAILHLSNLLSVELLQGASVQIEQFDPVGEPATTTLRHSGGVLVVDLTRQPETSQQLTLQTQYGQIAATGGRFVVVNEPDSSLEWVLALAAAQDELRVTAGGVTQPLVGGQARWMTPLNHVGATVSVSRGVEAWLNGTRNGADQPALSEILLPPANQFVDTGAITGLPAPGQPLELSRDVQGAIILTLDPKGIFGNPAYTLADCNGDDAQDVVIENGVLRLDFRPLLARVRAVDVSLLNRDRPGNGLLLGLDPANMEVARQQLEAGEGALQTLSLRSTQPLHQVELTVSNACFMGVSLTPPGEAGEVAQVRPVKEEAQSDTVVNVLAASAERLPQNGQLQALPVGLGQYAGLVQIDGAQSDWDSLAQQSGVGWTAISAITHNQGCDNRFPGAENLADLAGRVQLAYDDQHLYAAFVVNDDGLVTYSSADERLFLGDSLQLLLDLDLNGDFNDTQLSGDDIQIDLLPNPDVSRAVLWRLSSLTATPLDEALIAVTPTDTGYFLETAIPWRMLNTNPQPGDRLGIVASINDNDTPETDAQECIISTSPQRDWRNPATWGTALLVPAVE